MVIDVNRIVERYDLIALSLVRGNLIPYCIDLCYQVATLRLLPTLWTVKCLIMIWRTLQSMLLRSLLYLPRGVKMSERIALA